MFEIYLTPLQKETFLTLDEVKTHHSQLGKHQQEFNDVNSSTPELLNVPDPGSLPAICD